MGNTIGKEAPLLGHLSRCRVLLRVVSVVCHLWFPSQRPWLPWSSNNLPRAGWARPWGMVKWLDIWYQGPPRTLIIYQLLKKCKRHGSFPDLAQCHGTPTCRDPGVMLQPKGFFQRPCASGGSPQPGEAPGTPWRGQPPPWQHPRHSSDNTLLDKNRTEQVGNEMKKPCFNWNSNLS